jgi:23S rRNA (guanine2445-N2)-methyltransferase / 23S rRNA (guanine2069-N7)-methyltransferase
MEDVLDVQRDHPRLIRRCLDLLAPEGRLVFSTNLRSFRLEAGELSDCRIEDLSRATLPPDFARNPRIHQCWSIRR